MKTLSRPTFFRRPRRTAALLLAVVFLPAAAAAAGEKAAAADTDLVIPKSGITAQASYYPAEIDGYRMEIIAMLAPDGSIRTVFNACQVCFRSGKGVYVQEGKDLVCQSCKNHFPASSLEIARGGCNPVPVGVKNRTDSGDSIVIPRAFLERAKQYFSSL